jgi:hypothetical protein
MEAVYEDLVKWLPQEAYIHIDETGWKENGERRWMRKRRLRRRFK